MAQVVKNLTAGAGDIADGGSIPGSGRSPAGGHGDPLQYSCLENPQGQRGLESCSLCSGKESDTTERLNSKRVVHDTSMEHMFSHRSCDFLPHCISGIP